MNVMDDGKWQSFDRAWRRIKWAFWCWSEKDPGIGNYAFSCRYSLEAIAMNKKILYISGEES